MKILGNCLNFIMKTPLGKSYKFVRGVPQTYRAGKAAGGRVNGAKAVAKDLSKTFDGPIPSIFAAAGGVTGCITLPFVPGATALGMTSGYYLGKGVVQTGKLLKKFF